MKKIVFFCLVSSCSVNKYIPFIPMVSQKFDGLLQKPRIVEEDVYKLQDGTEVFSYKETFEYDKYGKLLKSTMGGKNMISQHFYYDKNGSVVGLELKNKDGEITGEDINIYDDNKNIIRKESWRDFRGRDNKNITSYSYDRFGRIIEQIGQEKGNLVFRNKFSYVKDTVILYSIDVASDNGKRITKKFYPKNMEVTFVLNTDYDTISVSTIKYDKHRNAIWAKSIYHSLNSRRESIINFDREFDKFGNWVYQGVRENKVFVSRRKIIYW